MKRLCVFYRLADRFLGNKKIEWIVCKECQRFLIRGEKPKVVWQKVHKPNATGGRAKHSYNPPNTQVVELGMAGRF